VKIILSDAHSSVDPGAVSGGKTEHKESRAITKRLAEILKEHRYDVEVLAWGSTLAYAINKLKSLYKKYDLAIEVHKNVNAPGIEVFYYSGDADGYRAATIVSKQAARVTGLKNRGAKPDTASARKRLGFLRAPGLQILIEAGSINIAGDNKVSHEIYAQAIAEGIFKAFPLPEITEAALYSTFRITIPTGKHNYERVKAYVGKVTGFKLYVSDDYKLSAICTMYSARKIEKAVKDMGYKAYVMPLKGV